MRKHRVPVHHSIPLPSTAPFCPRSCPAQAKQDAGEVARVRSARDEGGLKHTAFVDRQLGGIYKNAAV
jgi:hypothetical protein